MNIGYNILTNRKETMEVVEESVVQKVLTDEVLVNVSDGTTCVSNTVDESQKPNGVAEPGAMTNPDLVAMAETTAQDQIQVDSTTEHLHMPVETSICVPISEETVVSSESAEANAEAVPTTTEPINHLNIENQSELITTVPELTSKIPEEITGLYVGQTEEVIADIGPQLEGSTVVSNAESNDKVTFKTEILVERNENDANETDQNVGQVDGLDASKSMLSALRQNLELSDVLHPDNMENNNGSLRQEVLNKEELLNILEGDVEQADDQYIKIIQDDHTNIKTMEAQLALQQLTRLKSTKAKRADRTPRRKKGEKRLSQNSSEIKSDKKSEIPANETEIDSDENKGKKVTKVSNTSSKSTDISDSKTSKKDKKTLEEKHETMSPKNKKDKTVSNEVETASSDTKTRRNRKAVDIVLKVSENVTEKRSIKEKSATSNNVANSVDDVTLENESNKPNSEKIKNDLVKDWEDDEPVKDDGAEKLLEETQGLIKSAEAIVTALQNVAESDRIDGSSVDSSASFTSEGLVAVSTTTDEGQPQRRLGRVIKKKVIFDPDNPDTFTKGKAPVKTKETPSEKEQPTPKKIKTEIQQRPKSKSPTGKLHWKKPTPKPNKQNKRLSEVDRLLMDEGAVNMIYQLTPEAPKGKKNMRTKAEFIKKIQSSTPDGKEMKFRERKKEGLKEEGEAKKIISGKRGSLSSSIKSAGEDFEAHSADDSIIYRRHSSSSYSSNCMSPLRVNDQESSMLQDAARISRQISGSHNLTNTDEEISDQVSSEVFMPDMNTVSPSEGINKSDCMSIKQKLNSKLQNVLNKRKRDNTKTDKPAKQKRVTPKYDEDMAFKNEEQMQLSKLKNLTVKFEDKLAEIFVKRRGNHYNMETLKDLELALAYVNNKEDIAVTLLSSECGTLCSSLDLISLMDDDLQIRSHYAISFAETIRSLLSTVEKHSKLLCSGVWGACSGLGLALLALSDVAIAGEHASFALDGGPAPQLIGTAAYTHSNRLPKSTVDNLVIFGRRLSAEEALHGGLINRVIWPGGFDEQLHNIAKDIAKQPSRSLLVKKQLLTVSRSEKTFQSCLEAERDVLADYWGSDDSARLLRAAAAADNA